MSDQHSWLAIKGIADHELLKIAGLEETGEIASVLDDANLYSYGRMPGGSAIIFANSFRLGNFQLINELSQHCEVLVCRFEEGQDEPAATLMAAQAGRKSWAISTSLEALSVWGTPPPEFSSIHKRHSALINEDRLVMDDVLFELGKTLCGFRHDEPHSFKILRPMPDSPLVLSPAEIGSDSRATHPILERILAILFQHSWWLFLLVMAFVWLLNKLRD